MTISYKWLCEYLPVGQANETDPQSLSNILTSIGLEVESLEKFESVKGGLEGVVVGHVLEVIQHPNADKLKLTKVNIAAAEPLNIVCGAPNVAAGQKVLVATIGTTIYPANGASMTMKAAKIRGENSQGMICAEDELGLGTCHDGIMVLPADIAAGTKAADYFNLYSDHIFEIGLTPNRMDAMSHLGVAKDVCAYLAHHGKHEAKPRTPFSTEFNTDDHPSAIKVQIENPDLCKRYAGVSISGVTIKESPQWLKNKLMAIGQKPINNIVDITNFVLHETGQPIHAFDAAAIVGDTVVVRNARPEERFTTLDEKERKLDGEDILISNLSEGMCIAGVFGGAKSGISTTTKNVFLESAWFNPTNIRKTSLRHGLRTEAASRFEKGVDISNVVNVLKRAALLIKEVAGGDISSDIVDVYPDPESKTEVSLKYHYLKKLSGKNYHPDAVKKILTSLGFEVLKDGQDEIRVAVPFSKPDISLPADIVEEILRIDGLDNVDFPAAMLFTPSVDKNILKENLKEKIAGFLTGLGFSEIVTNSITNSRYYNDEELATTVKMINSLSADLDVMRPSMVPTGLETISYNINRRNHNLQFFEFGKTYHSSAVGKYNESEHLTLYVTGNAQNASWKGKGIQTDFYRAKGTASSIIQLCGLKLPVYHASPEKSFGTAIRGILNNIQLVVVGEVSTGLLKAFDIKQSVFVVDFDWTVLLELAGAQTITHREVPKFPAVQRDLSIVVDKNVTYEMAENVVKKLKLNTLQEMQLFDIFESEKLGTDKKSMAVSFVFIDEEKTLTDNETETIMRKLIKSFETELAAEIRR